MIHFLLKSTSAVLCWEALNLCHESKKLYTKLLLNNLLKSDLGGFRCIHRLQVSTVFIRLCGSGHYQVRFPTDKRNQPINILMLRWLGLLMYMGCGRAFGCKIQNTGGVNQSVKCSYTPRFCFYRDSSTSLICRSFVAKKKKKKGAVSY